MNKRFYFAAFATLGLMFAAFVCAVLEPGLAAWILFGSFVASALTLIYGYDRGRQLKDELVAAERARVHIVEQSEASQRDSEAANRAAREYEGLHERCAKELAGVKVELEREKRAARELEEKVKAAEARAYNLSGSVGAASSLAMAAVRQCERLLEAAMAAEKAGRKDERDEAFIDIVSLKKVFAADQWLRDQWYGRLPSFAEMPSAVLKEIVNGEAFRSRGNVTSNIVQDELEKAMARLYL